MDKDLRLALLDKEKAELFLSNLEKLHTNKTVNEISYSTLKTEYAANLQHAVAKIDQIKQELNKRLTIRSHELDIYKQELANLNARFKVGQLSADIYLKLAKNPNKKVNYLEDQISHLTSLINSQHSSEISIQEASGFASLFPSRSKPARNPGESLPNIEDSIAVAKLEEPPVIEEALKTYDTTSISSLVILPDRALPGSTIGVIATIVNTGQEIVHHKTDMKINDKIESVSDVILNPGQSEELTFMLIAGHPGDYYISVDNATGILRVM